jgi:hypothetical protein
MGESFCYCWFRVTSDMLLDLKSLELSYSVNSQIMVILIVSNENQDVLSMHVISVVTFRIMTNSVFDVDVGPVRHPHSCLLKKVIRTEATNRYTETQYLA